MKLTIQALEKKHNKTTFNCGYNLLDDYLKKQARQDVKRDLSACFVLVDESEGIYGYYTLSANSIKKEDFPENLAKKLPPSYQELPTILLGRLAIDKALQGKGYGEILLMDALKRCLGISESMGTIAILVDPIDEKAQRFYSRYGFILLPSARKMFLPLKTVKDLLL
jgi:GNAT superfamily N-acetyltransferase